MSCVVVGAGIAGLSVAYFLQKRGIKVTIYSSKEQKAASNIFTGILYRYPGRFPKKGKFADEGYQLSRELIETVEVQTGRKIVISSGVIKKFSLKLKKFPDVKIVDEDACIEDGVTISMEEYLEGLKDVIGREHFVEKQINFLEEISGIKIIAAGFGVKKLLGLPNFKYLKGQQLMGEKSHEKSSFGTVIGRGHISYLEGDTICLGSTYEKEFSNDQADEVLAETELLRKIEPWYGSLADIKNKRFASGIRVSQDTSYLPMVEKIDESTYVFTGLGSRGLLYHAYYGKILAGCV
jgi:glycine/D-amino acid oxidase-like deaminating enzyme